MIGEAVQTSRGLKRFAVLFVICALGGIFTNKFIQKTVQSHWVGLNNQMQAQNISVAAPRIVFARYGLPTFGAWVDTVSWRKPENCRQLRVLAKDIFVPIPFVDLILARPKAGAISISSLIVEHKTDPGCERGPLPVSDDEPGAVEGEWQNDSNKVSSAPKTFTAASVKKYVDGIRKWRTKIPFTKLDIGHIQIQNVDVSGKIISAEGSGRIVTGDTLDVNFRLRPFIIRKDKKSISTKLTVAATVSDDDGQLKVDWGYDEGHLLWTAHLDKANKIQSQFALSNLPVSVANRWLGTLWTFQFLWANCTISLNSSLNTLAADKWSASACSVKGPHGTLNIENVNLASVRELSELKADVTLKDFRVDEVVKSANELPLAGVVKKFGTLSGTLQFRGKTVASNFNVRGSEVLFSKNNRRTLQEVENLNVSLQYESKKWQVQLKDVILKPGLFQGQAIAHFDKMQRKWQVSLDLDAVAFSPEVQAIMLGGTLTPLSFKGSLDVNANGKIQNMKLHGGFASAEVNGLSFVDGIFIADSPEEGVRIGLNMAKVEIPRGANTDWLFVSLLDRATLTEKIVLSRMHSESSIASGHWTLKKASATALNGKFVLNGSSTTGVQSGTLEWNLPKYQYQWEWLRESNRVTLFPGSEAMREWLRINKDFSKEFKGVRILNQRENKGG